MYHANELLSLQGDERSSLWVSQTPFSFPSLKSSWKGYLHRYVLHITDYDSPFFLNGTGQPSSSALPIFLQFWLVNSSWLSSPLDEYNFCIGRGLFSSFGDLFYLRLFAVIPGISLIVNCMNMYILINIYIYPYMHTCIIHIYKWINCL